MGPARCVPTLKRPNPALPAWTTRPRTSASLIRTNRLRRTSLPNTIRRNTARPRAMALAASVVSAAVSAAATEEVAAIGLISGAAGAASVAAGAIVAVAISGRAEAEIFLLQSTLRRRVAIAVQT